MSPTILITALEYVVYYTYARWSMVPTNQSKYSSQHLPRLFNQIWDILTQLKFSKLGICPIDHSFMFRQEIFKSSEYVGYANLQILFGKLFPVNHFLIISVQIGALSCIYFYCPTSQNWEIPASISTGYHKNTPLNAAVGFRYSRDVRSIRH